MVKKSIVKMKLNDIHIFVVTGIGGSASLHVLCFLPLLLPDVRVKVDTEKIIYFTEGV